MQKLRNAEMKDLVPGTPVVVNISDKISDIGIFLAYNVESRKAIIADSIINKQNGTGVVNICEYDTVLVLPTDKESLAKMYKRV